VLEPAPADLDADAIVRRAEEALLGGRASFEARMTIGARRGSAERVLRIRAWRDRTHRRSLLRVTEPESDAGTAFLELDPNVWVYVPGIDRALLVPPGALRADWLGSDFRHDDLVRPSSLLDDYAHEVLGIDPRPRGAAGPAALVVASTPREGRGAWARVVTWIDAAHGDPLRREYYDERGELERVLELSDVREVSGRRVPHRWEMTRGERRPRSTRIEIESVRLDPAFEDGIFSTRRLSGAR
jgi:outer membrane lipoprotein-sorting protein